MLLSVVGNFLAKFETGGQTSSYVQTFANGRNIVGPTTLGVAASVCTWL